MLFKFIFIIEKYYLVMWELEGTLSIHTDEELGEPATSDRRISGESCTVRFGKKWYTGRIVSVGRLLSNVKQLALFKITLKACCQHFTITIDY